MLYQFKTIWIHIHNVEIFSLFLKQFVHGEVKGLRRSKLNVATLQAYWNVDRCAAAAIQTPIHSSVQQSGTTL